MAIIEGENYINEELLLRREEFGCGSLEVKVTDSWLTCHKIEPNNAEDPPSRCSLSMSRLKHPPFDVVWKLGEERQVQVLVDYGSKLRVRSPIALAQLCSVM
ncbi:hypothetical protein TNCV_4759261 [Trichonephila clavipes]|nr:hypothetical protein TNCV_4759261 [Trichonephila clavipes]